MNVDLLHVTQYRIYPADVIPLRPLLTQVGGDALKSVFKFKASGINQEVGDLVFQGGAIVRNDRAPIWIPSLSINERRIILQVDGTSEEANLVYQHITDALSVYSESERDWGNPLALVEETTCVVTLNVSWEEFFGAPAAAFISGPLLEILSTEDGKAYLKLPMFRFTIGFLESESFQRAGVILTDKVFAIEPRIDAPLSDRRYFTASPLGTGPHIEMLKQLEASVRGRKKR